MSDQLINELLVEPAVSSQLPPGARIEQHGPDPADVRPAMPRNPLVVRVAWGDLVAIEADVHVAGHYQSVLSAAAEGALDRAISGPCGPGLIAEHTRRRWLVGALGEIAYFPGAGPSARAGFPARPDVFTVASAEDLHG